MGGLDPFWEHFGSKIVAQRADFEGPGLNLGSMFHAFWRSSGSRARFWGLSVRGLDPFCDRFWEPNGAKKYPKCIQNVVRNGKCVFLVLSVSCRRELNLGGFGAPKSIKMMSENRLENGQVF